MFSNSDLDLDHRHLGSNLKLPLDIGYQYSKFGVNKPKQTKVIERKPKVDGRTPCRPLQHYNNPVFNENLVNKDLLKTWLIFNFYAQISCKNDWNNFLLLNTYGPLNIF